MPNTEKTRKSKLSLLREKLYQKAKREPRFKFYTLYGLIYRRDILEAALEKVRKNKGAAGIDGADLKSIEQRPGGIGKFLENIENELREKVYRPKPIQRVYIPKPNGDFRPLGIPTIKDRVVQTALLLVIEPIFEADFQRCSYGFRPGRSAHQAMREIERYLKEGYQEIYDADLRKYFDSIPHDQLMKCLEMRIVDKQVLKLIKKWLKVPVIQNNQSGKKVIQSFDRGTPQGGVISPLLANLYLHWFDMVFHRKSGPGAVRDAKLIRYSDDFVVMARKMDERIQKFIEDKIEKWLKLTINREKTRIVDMKDPNAKLSFLGFTCQYHRSKFKNSTYVNISPKEIALNRVREKIRDLTSSHRNFQPVQEVIQQLNQLLIGWGGYFHFGHPSKAFNKINYFVGLRLYRHLLRRSQRRRYKTGKDTWYQFFKDSGLIQLRKKLFVKV